MNRHYATLRLSAAPRAAHIRRCGGTKRGSAAWAAAAGADPGENCRNFAGASILNAAFGNADAARDGLQKVSEIVDASVVEELVRSIRVAFEHAAGVAACPVVGQERPVVATVGRRRRSGGFGRFAEAALRRLSVKDINDFGRAVRRAMVVRMRSSQNFSTGIRG